MIDFQFLKKMNSLQITFERGKQIKMYQKVDFQKKLKFDKNDQI